MTSDDVLAALLPTPDETALLCACLAPGGDAARGAWREWCAGRGDGRDLCRHLATWRTLLPLLARSAARHDLHLGPDVLSYVRAAALREELRAARFREIAVEAVAALQSYDIDPLVLRGAALAATVYESWSHRHCHDLDLLVDAQSLSAAGRALEQTGFRDARQLAATSENTVMIHRSGLAIAIHAQPFAIRYYNADARAFAREHRRIAFGRLTARAPAPEAMLIHVLGHASYSSSRRNLRWVADAWHLLASRELDWEDVGVRSATHRLDLPVSTQLAYLAALTSRVPRQVLERVRARSVRANRVAEDIAIGGLLAASEGRLLRLWRAIGSWRGRVRVARWAVAPSAAYVRSVFGEPAGWLVPFCYLYRPARFAIGRLTPRFRPTPRRS